MEEILETTAETANEEVLSGNKIGSVKIANDVVATIVGLATMEVKGVAAMAGGIAGGFTELMGKKNMTKGVKVEATENDVTIDVFVTMEFGVVLPDVADAVQNNVKKAVENMTGLNVAAVNVHIQGVLFPQNNPAPVAEAQKEEN
ncbi:MAG: Asp23/Gls24 family envelope stress response protein [Firmicutes bacterium]|nr:Asp23/Gls24 family envelope stress response protein [Bacillota bacterium]